MCSYSSTFCCLWYVPDPRVYPSRVDPRVRIYEPLAVPVPFERVQVNGGYGYGYITHTRGYTPAIPYVSLINTITDQKQSYITYTDPTLSWIQEVLPDQQMHLQGPRPVRNHFLKGLLHNDARVAFNLTLKPDLSHHTIQHLRIVYKLWDLPLHYEAYVCQSALTLPNINQTQFVFWNTLSFQAWRKFQIQLLSAFNRRIVMPSCLVQAYPPSADFPFGCVDTVLINPQTLTTIQPPVGGKYPPFMSPLISDLISPSPQIPLQLLSDRFMLSSSPKHVVESNFLHSFPCSSSTSISSTG